MSKREEIIRNKIGLDEETTQWVCNLTEKHHIWVANAIKDNVNIYKYRKNDLQTIMKWKKQNQSVKLGNIKFVEALSRAKSFFSDSSGFLESNGSLKNKKICLDLGVLKWVEVLTKEDCIEEGRALGNCLTSYYPSIVNGNKVVYSLRDVHNKPKLAFDITARDGRISNLFGPSNSVIKEKYIKPLYKLLNGNNTWKVINISHIPREVSPTIWSLILIGLNNKDYEFTERVIRACPPKTKEYLREHIKLKYSSHKKIGEILGLYIHRRNSYKFDYDRLDELMKLIEKGNARKSKSIPLDIKDDIIEKYDSSDQNDYIRFLIDEYRNVR